MISKTGDQAMNYFKILAILTALGSNSAYAAGSSDETEDTSGADYQAAEDAILAGDFEAALPILAALTKDEPDNADAWNLLGFASRKSGDLAAAEVAYSTALTIDPDHLGALEYQGEMFLDLMQPDKARANLARLQELCGECEEAEDLARAVAAAGA
jgi:Flp pilus assembly protein TadD